MLRRLVVAAAAMVVVPLAAMLPANAANAAATACADGVAVSQFAFNPPSISPTSSSVLTLVLQNCTSQTIQGSTIWWGQYIGPSGQHCVTLDPPAPFPYAIDPGGTYTRSATYQDIDSACSASLNVTANVNVNGVTGTATSVTATLQFTTACTSGVTVKQFSFSPDAVAVGQNSTLTLVLQNCTSQTVQGSSIWYPEFTCSPQRRFHRDTRAPARRRGSA